MKNVITFLNTLIFCIVACAVSVSLLILMISDQGQNYMFMILSIVAGLAWVIIYCLYKIINRETNSGKEIVQEGGMAVAYCPDYYTRTNDTCTNAFDVIDPYAQTSKTFKYVRGPALDGGKTAPPTVSLQGMEIKEGAEVDTLCKDSLPQTYGKVPWVNLEARCSETWASVAGSPS